jgi:uncharacterized Zn ribbon protein
MKLIQCKQCGGEELYRDGDFMVCKYCGTRFVIEKSDYTKQSRITVNSDVEELLNKCKSDPKNARKYANLVLDLDPDNEEALKYL